MFKNVFIRWTNLIAKCLPMATAGALFSVGIAHAAPIVAESDVGPTAGAVAPTLPLSVSSARYFQTFTATAGGSLDLIEVQIGTNSTQPYTALELTLFGVDGSGNPNTGDVLRSESINPGIATATSFTMEWVGFSLAPLEISAGDKFAISLLPGGTCASSSPVQCQYNWGYEGTGYSGGDAYFSGLTSTPNTILDFGFRATVNTGSVPIPLPATFALLGFGLACLGVAARRRKTH